MNCSIFFIFDQENIPTHTYTNNALTKKCVYKMLEKFWQFSARERSVLVFHTRKTRNVYATDLINSIEYFYFVEETGKVFSEHPKSYATCANQHISEQTSTWLILRNTLSTD